jgi:hypothetical protein
VTQREDADQVIYRFLDAGAGDAGT